MNKKLACTHRRLLLTAAMSGAMALLAGAALAQPGATGPAEHADVTPINNLPNPYETIRDWGTLPDGRSWGSVSAVHVDIDGVHIWAGDRCGANSCALSDVDPIVKLDPEGNVVQSFGAGQILWPLMRALPMPRNWRRTRTPSAVTRWSSSALRAKC